MPIRLRIFSIFLIVFNFELFADEFINGTLVTEVNNNSYDELNETRYKTIDGDFTINLPKNNEKPSFNIGLVLKTFSKKIWDGLKPKSSSKVIFTNLFYVSLSIMMFFMFL